METVGTLVKRGFFWSAGAFLFAVVLAVILGAVTQAIKQPERPTSPPPKEP